MTWQNLGRRNPEYGSRAWFATARRKADGRLYIYSGGTDPSVNALLRWNPDTESFEVENAGVAASTPWGGGTPPSVDNGWTAWDNVNDECYVNCVNPWSVPGLYTAATRSWRQVTRAEFPTFDWSDDSESLRGAFNAGVASNDRYIVVYGGQDGAGGGLAHLWVCDGQAPQATRWQTFRDHGIGPGKPGPQYFIQGQLSWNADIGRFLLVTGDRLWALDPEGWVWQAHPTTGAVPPVRSVMCVSRPRAFQLVACGGVTSGLWFLDLRTWTWTLRTDATMPADRLPRWDGIAWLEDAALYVGYGQESLSGEPMRDIFTSVLPAPEIGIQVISGVTVAAV